MTANSKNTRPIIKEVAYYHPENFIKNDFFIEHFDKIGKDVRGLLKSTGRDNRFIAEDFSENIVTMSIEASIKVLDKAHVKASDVNVIVLATGSPEYIMPSNAMIVHEAISGGCDALVYDINANCCGMMVAFEQVCRSMVNNKNIKYALVIGSDQLSRYARYDDALVYTNFADAACAILLENIPVSDSELDSRWLFDTVSDTHSQDSKNVHMPAKGLTQLVHNKTLHVKDKLIDWIPFDMSYAFKDSVNLMKKLLVRNGLGTRDVKRYFVSQFVKKHIKTMCSDLDEDINKFVFIGDEFGYTGTTSPFLALARSLENGDLKRGDIVIFWTVAIGTISECILYRY